MDKHGEDFTEAIFVGSNRRRRDPESYDVERLFLEWAWGTGHRQWKDAVRCLARALRGSAEAGLIERRTIRRVGTKTHHGFVLTEFGHQALRALAGLRKLS